jgi:hypothetical protein
MPTNLNPIKSIVIEGRAEKKPNTTDNKIFDGSFVVSKEYADLGNGEWQVAIKSVVHSVPNLPAGTELPLQIVSIRSNLSQGYCGAAGRGDNERKPVVLGRFAYTKSSLFVFNPLVFYPVTLQSQVFRIQLEHYSHPTPFDFTIDILLRRVI